MYYYYYLCALIFKDYFLEGISNQGFALEALYFLIVSLIWHVNCRLCIYTSKPRFKYVLVILSKKEKNKLMLTFLFELPLTYKLATFEQLFLEGSY